MKEKFLIFEVAPHNNRAWFLSVDDDRNITVEKTEKDVDLTKFFDFSRAPVRSLTQKSWEGEQMFKSHRRVIVAADPRLATTIPVPLELPRDDGVGKKSKITMGEAENMIAQAMQKIFNGCRTEAAARLNIHELDAVLVGARAKHFQVEGVSVGSPAGHRGKDISLLLELTFTTREMFENFQQFFNSPDDFFFAEAPQTVLMAFSKVRKLPLNLIVAGEDKTALYVFQHAKGEHPVLYRETLDWAFGSLFKTISEALAVSDVTARDLYRMYRADGMSDEVKRAFKKTLQPVLDDLLRSVEKAKVNGIVYVDAAHALPFDLPHKHGTATFEAYPMDELFTKFGFPPIKAGDQAKRMKAEDAAALRAMLYFLEAYFDKSNSEINQKLRRRLHWLKV